MRSKIPEFRGQVSDLGGPTANMYQMTCKDPEIERTCGGYAASIRRSARTSTPTTAR